MIKVKTISKKIQKNVKKFKPFFAQGYNQTILFIKKYPIASFFGTLFLLFFIIAVGSFIRKPQSEESQIVVPKEVQLYHIGTSPTISVQGQVEKSGVITITAQTAGIVQSIPVIEGTLAERGTIFVNLATNYFGGNAFFVQRQIAEKQYQQVVETFDLQKDTIAKQKEIAEQSDANSDEFRKIVDQSLGNTRDALSLNEEILSIIDTELTALEATNSGTVNPSPTDSIFSLKQLKSQYLAAVNQLKDALRNTEYQADENSPPSKLSDLQRELAIKQLEIQEKTLELTREISELQVQLARTNEGLMYPAAPFQGIVERVHVRVGQQVTPGTPLVTFNGRDVKQTIMVAALVSDDIARNVSRFQPSALYLGNETIKSIPAYISTEATHGQLYSVLYVIPESFHSKLTDKSRVRVDIPVGYPDTGRTVPFIPLDAIHQTQNAAFVFVDENDSAVSREVQLGNVFGRYVEIRSGIENKDVVIVSRNVITGDKVTSKK